MHTTCPSCSERFSRRSALCDDWKDPKRAFGCPHCGTFFYTEKENYELGPLGTTIFTAAFLAPAHLLGSRHELAGTAETIIYFAVILSAVLGLVLFTAGPWKRELKESPYKPGLGGTAGDSSSGSSA